jgi:hypothetical protein
MVTFGRFTSRPATVEAVLWDGESWGWWVGVVDARLRERYWEAAPTVELRQEGSPSTVARSVVAAIADYQSVLAAYGFRLLTLSSNPDGWVASGRFEGSEQNISGRGPTEDAAVDDLVAKIHGLEGLKPPAGARR